MLKGMAPNFWKMFYDNWYYGIKTDIEDFK